MTTLLEQKRNRRELATCTALNHAANQNVFFDFGIASLLSSQTRDLLTMILFDVSPLHVVNTPFTSIPINGRSHLDPLPTRSCFSNRKRLVERRLHHMTLLR